MRRFVCCVLVACSHPSSAVPTAIDATAATPDTSAIDDAPSSTGGLPLGTATVTQPSVACPAGAPAGATCKELQIACPGVPDIDVLIADTEPAGGATRGTIVAHDGGAGTGLYNGNTGKAGVGFAQSLTVKGYRFVQVAWATDWASTGHGIKTAGCRPATLFRWIFDNVHGGSRTTGFCAMSSSGGTAAVLYSIAAYGLKNIWDYLQLAAGPTPARIDYGCEPSLYTGGERDLCPLLTTAPWQYKLPSSSILSIADGWEGTQTCGSASPPAADVATWANDSLISPSADLDYPQTTMTFWHCATTPNMSTGQSTFFIDQVHPKNDPVEVNCYSGTCQAEEVFEDSGAFDLAVQEMASDCVPNH